jgi:primosomal protein N'
MVLYNGSVDPYRPEGSYYECRDCGAHVDGGDSCDKCGSDALTNIAVARE